MEKVFRLEQDGQAVQQQDVNALGEVSGLADDRVFAELFRMTPTDGATVSKGVLVYGHQTSGATGLIAPNGASGSVLVNPFRVFIGSRTEEATEALDNWRDVRSGLSVAEGDTELAQTVSFAANSSGDPRWDAVYATVAIDASTSTVTRKVKDPTSGNVTDQSVSLFRHVTVTLGVVTGTTDPAPDWPTLPSDAGDTYYVILGYVKIPDGFNGTSVVLPTDIAEMAPALTLSGTTGGKSMSVANQQYTVGGSCLSAADIQNWGAEDGSRPDVFMPPTWVGGESLLIYLDLTNGSESHANDSVVDSRDWRNRIARWCAVTAAPDSTSVTWSSGSGPDLPSNHSNTTYEGAFASDPADNHFFHGMGTTFQTYASAPEIGGSSNAGVLMIHGKESDQFGSSNAKYIQILAGTNGELRLGYSTGGNHPNTKVLIWIDFTGPFANAL